MLVFAGISLCVLMAGGCAVRAAAPSVLPTPEAGTATVIGKIILGYEDHRPVADLPLWLGLESHGQPAARTNASGEFILTGLPVGETVDVVDDHLSFRVLVSHSGLIHVGTIEYPLIHPPMEDGRPPISPSEP